MSNLLNECMCCHIYGQGEKKLMNEQQTCVSSDESVHVLPLTIKSDMF